MMLLVYSSGIRCGAERDSCYKARRLRSKFVVSKSRTRFMSRIRRAALARPDEGVWAYVFRLRRMGRVFRFRAYERVFWLGRLGRVFRLRMSGLRAVLERTVPEL